MLASLAVAGRRTPALSQQPRDTIPDNAWLEIHVVDVGQGDGIWIQTWDDGIAGNGRFDGRNIVIDGGPVGADRSNPFLAYLEAHLAPSTRIDALLISHAHNDHYPGAAGVLRHFPVCDYYDPGFPDPSAEYHRFLALVTTAQCDGHPIVEHIGRDSFGTPAWGSELSIRFLYAWPGSNTGLGSGNSLVNNSSIVMKLTYGSQSILFMGDAEGKERHDSPNEPKYVEKILLAEYPDSVLHATVLKIAHHGSETSSTLPFIRAVDPAIVIVSSGRKSFAGTYLPDQSTLTRYCAWNRATRIYRTDQNDAAEGRTTRDDADHDDIVIRMNGKRTEVMAEENGKPFDPPPCTRS